MTDEDNISYIFGKTLTQHLQDMPTNDRYLRIRIARFSEEFLNADVTLADLDDMLSHIYDYLWECEENRELSFTLINLEQAIYWLRQVD